MVLLWLYLNGETRIEWSPFTLLPLTFNRCQVDEMGKPKTKFHPESIDYSCWFINLGNFHVK